MNTTVAPMRTAAETALLERFATLKRALPGAGDVLRQREEAFALLESEGLPHRRVEDWKYTDLRALMREAPPPAEPPSSRDIEAALKLASPSLIDAAKLTFINGHFIAKASDIARLPAGVSVVALNEALAKGDPALAQMGGIADARSNTAYALNTAFMADGAVIRVAGDIGAAKPLLLRFINHGKAAFATAPRVLVVVEDGASVTLVESHEGTDGLAYQSNAVVEIVGGDRAQVTHVRLNREGEGALALSTLAVKLGAGADLKSLNVTAGSSVSRHQVFLTFAGEGATANVNGATMIKGEQHADTTLVVDHAVPACESRELFKTIIDGEATGVFQGKIIVRPDAQKTDGRMMSAAVLLSETGTMNNKPELEIFADDVQCAHGATCGALDDDLLFYLMARGLPRPEAEALMVQAFVGEALELVDNEELREALGNIAEGWLRGRTKS
jgi:Fe-S cluster assembly protein SufD